MKDPSLIGSAATLGHVTPAANKPFKHPNFGGRKVTQPAGGRSHLPGWATNSVSSVKVPHGRTLHLYEHPWLGRLSTAGAGGVDRALWLGSPFPKKGSFDALQNPTELTPGPRR